MREFERVKKILNKYSVKFKDIIIANHHLSHACGAFFTSNFNKALILSYDGSGNDGKTILFHGEGNKVSYLKKFNIWFGSTYNNMGYILNVRPEINKLTSGKIMGLAGHGNVRKEWIPNLKEHILRYEPRRPKLIKGPTSFGKDFLINSDNLDTIPELKPYLVPTPFWVNIGIKLFKKLYKLRDFFLKIINRILSKMKIPSTWINYIDYFKNILKKKFDSIYVFIENRKGYVQFEGIESQDAKDLICTFQVVWTDLILKLLEPYSRKYKKLCLTGGCALNGITNYAILNKWGWENVHLIPNPSDCGLSIGIALMIYWEKFRKEFQGYNEYLDPYLGFELFDKDKLELFKEKYPHRLIDNLNYLPLLADLINRGKIVGFIQGKAEIGPRALGNRSILCNPIISDMKKILNSKVKHREWYRPFAPVCTFKDSNKYFTVDGEINYMSVICYTKDEFKDVLTSITHVDGSARLQTITRDKNPVFYALLKEFEKLSGYPILLNTSLNPRGQPILNYIQIGIDMIYNTDMDYLAYNNVIFGRDEN